MKTSFIILIIALLSFWNRGASAFWGNNPIENAGGVNVAAGYDVNTVTTVTGTVITPPERKRLGQHTEMSVASTQGNVTVILGPWGYWETHTITITKNQEISITGSLAQGKDGAFYIFAQRLENRSNGETIMLRSESGKPLWSRSGSGNQNGNSQYYGNGTRSGAGNRDSGMGGGRRWQ